MKRGSSQTSPAIGWTIGELAARAGVSASAIRYYERRGLLPAPPRRHKWRYYDRAALDRLRLIVRARASGFSLWEIAALQAAAADGRDRRALIAARQADVRAKLQRIQGQLVELEQAADCACRTASDCVLLARS